MTDDTQNKSTQKPESVNPPPDAYLDEGAPNRDSGGGDDRQRQIHGDHLYRVPEAAKILGLHVDTVYRIPSKQLTKTRVGPRGGRTRIRGAHLLRYINGKES